MSHIKTDLTSEQEYHSEHRRLTLELLLPSYTHVVVIQDTPFDLQHYNNTPQYESEREGKGPVNGVLNYLSQQKNLPCVIVKKTSSYTLISNT